MENLSPEKEPLVVNNLNMVHFILKKHCKLGLLYEDLYQVYPTQAASFDPSGGGFFLCFSDHIRSVKKISEKSSVIRHPRDIRDLQCRLAENEDSDLSPLEVAESHGFKESQLRELMLLTSICSLEDEIQFKDSSVTISEVIPDYSQEQEIDYLFLEEAIMQFKEVVLQSFQNNQRYL